MPPIRRSYKRVRRFIAANGEICTSLTIDALFFSPPRTSPSLALDISRRPSYHESDDVTYEEQNEDEVDRAKVVEVEEEEKENFCKGSRSRRFQLVVFVR